MRFLAKLFASGKKASEEQAAAVDTTHNGEEVAGSVSEATVVGHPEEIDLPGDEVKFKGEASEQDKEIDISV